MPVPTFDIPAAHRWFAIEFNNRAWDLVEAASRTPEEAERMLLLAHAATLHWSEAGTPVNQMRALSLLAMACAAAGDGKSALRFAKRCAGLSAALNDEQTLFDRASAAVGLACALRCDGKAADALIQERAARALADQLTDADDRQVIDRLLSIGPTEIGLS